MKKKYQHKINLFLTCQAVGVKFIHFKASANTDYDLDQLCSLLITQLNKAGEEWVLMFDKIEEVGIVEEIGIDYKHHTVIINEYYNSFNVYAPYKNRKV
jgi:hypothetical protein